MAKYYVVWEGRQPGIYSSWEEVKKQVSGYPNAMFKSYDDRSAAEAAFLGNYWEQVGQSSRSAQKTPAEWQELGVDLQAVATDAACSGNPGKMEYRGVVVGTGELLFQQGVFEDATNNIGEFLALVHALALLHKIGEPHRKIYTDSYNALLWVKSKKCRTKLHKTDKNAAVFELIQRAEAWLALHPVTNPIEKWQTQRWGEIPADFQRK